MSHVAPETRRRAKALRRSQTPPERRLWTALRSLKASGFHFRRQAPIGAYIVDFICLSAKLIVEADGFSHAAAEAAAHDARRDAFLRREGFRVLRISHAEVATNLDGVVETVLRELGHAG